LAGIACFAIAAQIRRNAVVLFLPVLRPNANI
jgi:hypothetical protein